MTRVAIALGSNLGDRLLNLQSGVAGIARFARVVAGSHIYETAPVGGPDQGPYLNAVVLVDTNLPPAQLLAELLRVEAAAGRVRREKWGPRTLDLDIIAIDGPPVEQPGLTIPHPRAKDRRFVLQPLIDVWPEAPVGVGGLTAGEALGAVADQKVALVGGGLLENKGVGWVAAQLALLAMFVTLLVMGASSVSPLQRVAGWAVALTGGLLFLTAIRRLGPNMTPYPQPPARGRVVAEGPYRLVRHPIYGGLILGCLGLAVGFGASLALATVLPLAVLLWFKAKDEERRLLATHADYSEYVKAVPRRFLPWVL